VGVNLLALKTDYFTLPLIPSRQGRGKERRQTPVKGGESYPLEMRKNLLTYAEKG